MPSLGSSKVWSALRGVCLIQSSVADIRAVLGSGQDGVLSDAVVGPYCGQDATGDSAT